MSVLRPGGGQTVFPRSLRWSVATFVGQSRFERICDAGIEDDALLLEPKAARSERTNQSRGEVEVEIKGPADFIAEIEKRRKQ
jgi:hypothetical protein